MKKTLPLIAAMALAFSAMETKAQLADGSTAPNFTFTDMNGVSQDLYTYLNSGKSVVIDISATWCGPCWSYHNSKALENFYTQKGPSGTNEAMVIFVEGDNATTNADMNGTGGNTQGNWVAGTPYPMCNPTNAQGLSTFNTGYAIGYFPTMYLICTDKKTKKVDQYSTAQLISALATCPPPTPTQAIDAGIPSIISPNGQACGSSFAPVVTLRNFGINALTSCTINFKVDNNTNQTFSWTGNLASTASINVTLPNVTTTAGTHSFTCSTSNPNAGTDGNTSNDQKISTFTATTSTMSTPLVEGIENATFPPAGWMVTNPDGGVTWARTTAAKKTGTASMWVNGFAYTSNGEVDEFTSTPVNLSMVSTPTLSFQVAYQLQTNPSSSPNWSDTLQVRISTDCGVTWATLYNKCSTALTTTTPTYSSSSFVPTASQWRLETVSLGSYASATSALIKFRHSNDYENNMYIDDINITGGANSTDNIDLSSYVSVFPNPSSGDVFVNISANNLGDVNVKLTNILGETISESKANASTDRNVKLDLTNQPNGVYLVEVSTAQGRMVQKVLLNK